GGGPRPDELHLAGQRPPVAVQTGRGAGDGGERRADQRLGPHPPEAQGGFGGGTPGPAGEPARRRPREVGDPARDGGHEGEPVPGGAHPRLAPFDVDREAQAVSTGVKGANETAAARARRDAPDGRREG